MMVLYTAGLIMLMVNLGTILLIIRPHLQKLRGNLTIRLLNLFQLEIDTLVPLIMMVVYIAGVEIIMVNSGTILLKIKAHLHALRESLTIRLLNLFRLNITTLVLLIMMVVYTAGV